MNFRAFTRVLEDWVATDPTNKEMPIATFLTVLMN